MWEGDVVARGQERCHLRRRRLDRGCGSPRLRPRGSEGPSRWSKPGEPRESGEEHPFRGRGGRDGQVDALDETAVDEHADAVVPTAGSIDVSFNLISHGDVQGTPLAEMTLEDFERPVVTAVRTMFLTSRAAARHMIKQRSGAILVFGGDGDPLPGYYLGGLQVAFSAWRPFGGTWPANSGRTASAS